MPELGREEFNVYKKTIYQEYIYEFIFKEGKPSTCSGIELPDFSTDCEESSITPPDFSEFELSSAKFINEVI